MLQLHIQSPLLAILHDQLIIVVDKINLLLAWISTETVHQVREYLENENATLELNFQVEIKQESLNRYVFL